MKAVLLCRVSSKEQEEYFTPKISESGQVKTLLSWTAPSRPFRAKDRSYYTTVAILVILVAAIAFMASEFMLIVALLSFMFVVYVLAYVPPHDVQYKITKIATVGVS